MDSTVGHVEAVIKVTERCNINCDYCYVYHKGNEDYLARPALMKFGEFEKIVDFLVEGARELNADTLSVIFHGGEPLLLKKAAFDKFCGLIRSRCPTSIRANIGVQTNAILLDEEWIGIFREHHVSVSVSMDGPATVHDTHRRDHRGRGTHADVVRGLALLQRAADEEVLPQPGVICVIDPTTDSRAIYRYFVDELKITNLSFHLPMDTHETGAWIDNVALSRYLGDLFDEWGADDNPSIHIRMFEEIMAHFLRKPGTAAGHGATERRLQHVTISTDGTIGVDELKPSGIRHDAYDVGSISLSDYANSDLSRFLRSMYGSIPTDCAACIWASYCGGGSRHGVAVNRWSAANGFNNRSLICGPLKSLYARIARYLITSGTSAAEIEDNLRLDRHAYTIAPLGPQVPHRGLVMELVC